MKNRSGGLRSVSDRFGDARGTPRTPQGRSKTCPERPKTRQERPKRALGSARDAPRSPGNAPRAVPRRPETSKNARPCHSCRQTPCETAEDRFFCVFGWSRASSEVSSDPFLPVFCRCRTIFASRACRTEKPRKNDHFGFKNRRPRPPGRAGGASSSAKTAKSSEQVRPTRTKMRTSSPTHIF